VRKVDFTVYNPFDAEFVRNPWPVFERMLSDYPVAYHTGLKAWLVAPHELAWEVTRSPRFSTNFADWSDAPPSKPESEWNLYDRVRANNLGVVSRADHLRLRKLTAPAFSRHVMDQIEERIRGVVSGVFDEISDPREFNAAEQIAVKVPMRAIAAMVGVPAEASELFEHGLGWNSVRASNPVYAAADRDKYVQGTLPGLQYVLDLVGARRVSGDFGDDFVGTLLSAADGDDRLTDLEIVALISALVTAGADTAVDLHTLALYALLTHPDQRALLRSRPDLYESAILEILRWGAPGKLGAIPRYPLENTEVGGQVLGKGSFVMPLMQTAWNDPAKWDEPRRFDITRDHSGNIIFGAGPHLCIGLNLVKVQGRLMIEEFERRFGDTAELIGEPEYDPNHFNARRITKLTVRTGT
jgi:cytochrome P450